MNANPDEIRFLADALWCHLDTRKLSAYFCAIAPADVNHNGVTLRDLVARAAIAAERLGLDPGAIMKLNRVVSDADLLAAVEVIERLGVKLAALKVEDALAGSPKPAKRTNAGRRKKTDSRAGAKILAALCLLHKYNEGSVLIPGPILVADLKDKSGVSQSSITRFFQAKFKDRDPSGYDAYAAACRQDRIAYLLQLWQGEVPALSTLQYRSESDADE